MPWRILILATLKGKELGRMYVNFRAGLAHLSAMQLSNRERDVLCLAATGLTDEGIAVRLGIAAKTVRTYWERLKAKLNAESRLHAYAIWVYEDRP